jgi:hypothetical protein
MKDRYQQQPSHHHVHPLHEISNPAPAPTTQVFTAEHDIVQPLPGSLLRDTTPRDPDYYIRNLSNGGTRRIGTNEHITTTLAPSRNHEPLDHRTSRYNTTHEERKSSRPRPHHRHHHRRLHHRDDSLDDRHSSSSRSEVTAYRKVEAPAAPADKNGQYVYRSVISAVGL